MKLTIEKKPGREGYTVYEYGIYPRNSVLAGQESKKYRGVFSSVQEAQDKFPKATTQGYQMPAEVPKHAPQGYYDSDGGFYDCGEYWGEDDY